MPVFFGILSINESVRKTQKKPVNTGIFLCFRDSTSIILDPSVDGTNYTSSAANATWSVTFPNYTISGIASCNSLSGTYGSASPEYNNQITAGYQDGQSNCWCRMMGPVRSAWVFYRTFSSASECASECADYCGYFVRGNANVRGGVFGSAGN